MNPRFTLLAALVGGASLLTSTGAHASPAAQPGITSIGSTVLRLEPNGEEADGDAAGNPHPAGVATNVIDLDDCNADLAYEFELSISNLNEGYNLNAWIGAQDCTELSNRQTSATAVCWPATPPTAALTNTTIIRARMRDIVSQAFETTHSVLYDPAPNIVADPAPALCKMQGGLPAEPLSLYFFFADAQGNAVGTAQQYPLTVDLVANPTPTPAVQTSGSDGGCSVASTRSSQSTAFTLAVALGAVALVRRRRATGTRRGSASRSSSRSA